MRRAVAVVIVMVSITVAFAQDVETIMRGRTQLAQPTLAEAWQQNPATLGLFAAGGASAETGAWSHNVSGVYELEGPVDLRAITWGGHRAGNSYGLGAGWVDVAAMRDIGLGFGMAARGGRLAWGLNYQNVDPDFTGADTLNVFDLGFAGAMQAGGTSATRATWGVVMRDATDESLRTYDAGLAAETSKWLLALDVQDITDEEETILQVGASTYLGERRQWQVGGGLDDGDPTLGLVHVFRPRASGQVWKLGVAWGAHDDTDDAWVLGLSTAWGH